MSQNLFFNVLTFNYPDEQLLFYFSLTEIGRCHRLHVSQYPNVIEIIFPGLIDEGVEFIYTSFDYEKEDFIPLQIDLETENENLVKKYYNDKVYCYFKKKLKLIAKTGFINETIVWLPAKDKSTIFNVYERISLKIQLHTVSDYPELLVSYDGKARVHKQSVRQLLTDVAPEEFNWVLQEQSIFRYEKMVEFDDPDYDTAFPIMSNRLRKALGIAPEEIVKGNKYLKYKEHIDKFYWDYLYTEEFTKYIPLHDDGLLNVHPSLINFVNDASNDLAFENDKKGRIPKWDIRNLKPYQKSPWNKIHLFFIVHYDDGPIASKINVYFQTGLSWFKGMYDFASLMLHTEKSFSIVFKNKDNPLEEIEQALEERNFNPDIRYIGIYVTPFSKYVEDEEKRAVYYRVKELLLKRNITSQAIEALKIKTLIDQNKESDYVYSLLNLGVAMLAKLNGVPWRLHATPKNELIVGVGAFKHEKDDVRYIGSAFSFNNLGNFNGFDYFMQHDTDLLAGSIVAKVKEFATLNEVPDRLIIHFYKVLNQKELEPIEKALQELELNMPVYIIAINKTESENIVAFDLDYADLMPDSGTYINIGNNKYLLYNNTKYSGSSVGKMDGYPFPVKLAIDCTDKAKLEDEMIIKELIDQVYQFSRMYWKSVKQQSLPVTIRYPEMVAQIAPYFEGDDIPLFGKDNLWFL